MEVLVTTGAISCAKLHWNRHRQQTNTQLLPAGCPSCRPTNSVKALKGNLSHSMDLLTPSSPRGLPTLSLTTKGSWLPWGRVAMPSDASTVWLAHTYNMWYNVCHKAHRMFYHCHCPPLCRHSTHSCKCNNYLHFVHSSGCSCCLPLWSFCLHQFHIILHWTVYDNVTVFRTVFCRRGFSLPASDISNAAITFITQPL